jgi:hypothetical protein
VPPSQKAFAEWRDALPCGRKEAVACRDYVMAKIADLSGVRATELFTRNRPRYPDSQCTSEIRTPLTPVEVRQVMIPKRPNTGKFRKLGIPPSRTGWSRPASNWCSSPSSRRRVASMGLFLVELDLAFEDLAGCALGHGVDDVHLTWVLVRGDLALDEDA